MSDHALLSPSGADRWVNCPGSIRMEKGLPESISDAALEGSVFHKWSDDIYAAVKKGCAITELLLRISDIEMRFHVEDSIKNKLEIESLLSAKNVMGEVVCHGEHRVYFSDNIWGTVDFCAYTDLDVCLYDDKYGKRYAVGAVGNLQIICYALALRKTYDLKAEKYHGYIFQPRAMREEDRGLKPWHFSSAELDVHERTIVTAEKRALELYAEDNEKVVEENLNVGKWCTFCKAKFKCPEYMKKHSSKGMDIVLHNPFTKTVSLLTTEDKLAILKNKKAIENYLDACGEFLKNIEHELVEKLRVGADIPGWKLVESRGRRGWIEDVERVARVLKENGIDEPFQIKKSLIGIGEAERVLGKGKEAKALLSTVTEIGGVKLQIVPAEDERSAVSGDVLPELPE